MTVRTDEQRRYHRNHARVYGQRGKASQYECVKCDGPAQEWATVHGESGDDPWADYVAMCRSCHHSYDNIAERSAKSRTGQKRTADMRLKMSLVKKGRNWSLARRAAGVKPWSAEQRRSFAATAQTDEYRDKNAQAQYDAWQRRRQNGTATWSPERRARFEAKKRDQ